MTREQLAEHIYVALERQGGWVDGWKNQPLSRVTIDGKFDLLEVADVILRQVRA